MLIQSYKQINADAIIRILLKFPSPYSPVGLRIIAKIRQVYLYHHQVGLRNELIWMSHYDSKLSSLKKSILENTLQSHNYAHHRIRVAHAQTLILQHLLVSRPLYDNGEVDIKLQFMQPRFLCTPNLVQTTPSPFPCSSRVEPLARRTLQPVQI